jgi:hypothetical protein
LYIIICQQFGWEEILKPRTLVAASNLQWRHGAAVRWIPCAYVSELSSFSVNPRQPHLQQALTLLHQEIGQQVQLQPYSDIKICFLT